MEREAIAIVAAGALGARLETHRAVEMRYLGQGHEIAVPLPSRALTKADAATLRADYERRYEAQFGLRIAGVRVEFLTWSVSVATVAKRTLRAGTARKRQAPRPNARQSVFDPGNGKSEALPAWRREDLLPGMQFRGPALVVEPQTTTLVPRDWRAGVTASGHLLLERQS